MPAAYIGLGSNLGDRIAYLRQSLHRLEIEPVSLRRVSPLYETLPVGGPPQGNFLNACAFLETALPPVSLLRLLQEIEGALGRVRGERWGPRRIDLDLLLYEEVIMHTPLLELPHPRLQERDFVLRPLSTIAPNLVIPGIWETVQHLLERRPLSAGGVLLYQESWYSPVGNR